MVDATTFAVIIVVAVVLLAFVMFIMICKHSKQQLGADRRISQRELRRKSRLFSVVMAHHHIPRIITPRNVHCNVTEPTTHSAESREQGPTNGETASDAADTSSTSWSRGGEENQSNTVSVSVPSPCNHDNPTQLKTVEVENESLPPSQTNPVDEYMYDYKPAQLPPLNPAPVQMQYRYPDEVRGSDVSL